MAITKQDIKRIIKEELKKVLMEDISPIPNMNPRDALEFMEEMLEGKTLIFWDLETVSGMTREKYLPPELQERTYSGQITQIGATAYEIETLDDDPAQALVGEPFERKVILTPDTLMQQAFEREQLKDPESPFSKLVARQPDAPITVDKTLLFTHHKDLAIEDVNEADALIQYFDWLDSFDNKVLLGHNIITFDNQFLKKRVEYLANTLEDKQKVAQLVSGYNSFYDNDFFDTLKFTRYLFKNVITMLNAYEDPTAAQFFDPETNQKRIEKGITQKFTSKLSRLMQVYAKDAIQLHTAADDTKQLVNVFFKMYQTMKTAQQDPTYAGHMASPYYTDPKKAAKQLFPDDLEKQKSVRDLAPDEITRMLKRKIKFPQDWEK